MGQKRTWYGNDFLFHLELLTADRFLQLVLEGDERGLELEWNGALLRSRRDEFIVHVVALSLPW